VLRDRGRRVTTAREARAMKLRATLCFVLVMVVGVMPGHAGLTIGLTRSLRICLSTN